MTEGGVMMKMMMIACCLMTWTTVQAQIDTHNISLSWETKLVHDLLARYRLHGTDTRPMINSSEPILLYFGIRLITLDLDEKTQILTTSAWLRHRWYDDFLTWEPEEYGGKTHVILSPQSVWMPEDIALVNTADADLKQTDVQLQVRHTGRVFYAPHMVYKSGCLVDLTNYPYDVQTCDLWIQSASRYSWDLRLVPYSPTSLDLDTYLGSFKDAKDWDVVGNSTEYVSNPRKHGAILMYSRRGALRFTFVLRRRLGFMAVLLVLPCIFLAMMIPVIFCLPTERPDRHMLAMSLFASFMVLLLILTQNAPPSAASVPKLGKYYCFNLLIIIVAIFVSVFVIFVNKRAETKQTPPRCLQILFLKYLAVLFCLRDRARILLKTSTPKDERREPMLPMSEKEESHVPSRFPNIAQLEKHDNSERVRMLQDEVQRLTTKLQDNQGNSMGGGGPSVSQQQWRLITLILDRFCAVTFFLINIIALIALTPMPADGWKE